MLAIVEGVKSGPIAVLATRWTRWMVKMAIEGNVSGFLLTNERPKGIAEKLRRIHSGERCFSDAIEREIERNPKTGRIKLRNPCPVSELSERELAVIRFLVEGLSVKQVAERMDVTYKAIDSVKFRVMQRLGLNNRVELARFAIREGLAAA